MTLARTGTPGTIRSTVCEEHAVVVLPVPHARDLEAALGEELLELLVRDRRHVVVELERDRANSAEQRVGQARQDQALGALAVELEEVDALEPALGQKLG